MGYRVDDAMTCHHHVAANVYPTISIDNRAGADPASIADYNMTAIGIDQYVFKYADMISNPDTQDIIGIGTQQGLAGNAAMLADCNVCGVFKMRSGLNVCTGTQ